NSPLIVSTSQSEPVTNKGFAIHFFEFRALINNLLDQIHPTFSRLNTAQSETKILGVTTQESRNVAVASQNKSCTKELRRGTANYPQFGRTRTISSAGFVFDEEQKDGHPDRFVVDDGF